jgi:hypothetical protein
MDGGAGGGTRRGRIWILRPLVAALLLAAAVAAAMALFSVLLVRHPETLPVRGGGTFPASIKWPRSARN